MGRCITTVHGIDGGHELIYAHKHVADAARWACRRCWMVTERRCPRSRPCCTPHPKTPGCRGLQRGPPHEPQGSCIPAQSCSGPSPALAPGLPQTRRRALRYSSRCTWVKSSFPSNPSPPVPPAAGPVPSSHSPWPASSPRSFRLNQARPRSTIPRA